MARIMLTGERRWFDTARAQNRWPETREFDGRNLISRATGDQWTHDVLWHTATGRWIIVRSSDWQGVPDRVVEVSPHDAAAWLIRCGYDVPEALAGPAAEMEV